MLREMIQGASAGIGNNMMDSVKSSFQTLVELGLLQKDRAPQTQKPVAVKPPRALKVTPLPKDDTSSIDLNDTQQSQCSSVKEELKDLLEDDSRLQALCQSFHSKTPVSPSPTTPTSKRLLTPQKASKLGSLLYERGVDMIKNRKLHAQEIFDREHPFKPQIDSNSSRIIEEKPRKPLYSPRKLTEDTVSTQEEEPKRTLTPTGLNRFILRNYNTPIERRKGRLNRVKATETDSECTFSPHINPASPDFLPVFPIQQPKSSLYKRAMDQIQRRKERSQSGDRVKEEKETVECTFTPEIGYRTSPRRERKETIRSRKEPVDIREALKTVERLSKKLIQ